MDLVKNVKSDRFKIRSKLSIELLMMSFVSNPSRFSIRFERPFAHFLTHMRFTDFFSVQDLRNEVIREFEIYDDFLFEQCR